MRLIRQRLETELVVVSLAPGYDFRITAIKDIEQNRTDCYLIRNPPDAAKSVCKQGIHDSWTSVRRRKLAHWQRVTTTIAAIDSSRIEVRHDTRPDPAAC